MKWLIALLLFGVSLEARAESQFENLQVLPADIEDEELRTTMNAWSVALGFRCDQCHYSPTGKFDDLDFASDKKETKRTAREMFHMMTQLNETFFADRGTKLSCYTCHHGTNDPRSLDEILTASLDEGGFSQVEHTYRKLRKKYYGFGAYNFGAWTGLASVADQLIGQQLYEDAKLVHELNLEYNPDYDGSHFALGAHYLAISPSEDQARLHLTKAMSGNSHWTPIRILNLASNLFEENEPEAALRTLRMLVEVAPDFADGHFELGQALARAGDSNAARAAYRLALEKQPDHEGAREALRQP